MVRADPEAVPDEIRKAPEQRGIADTSEFAGEFAGLRVVGTRRLTPHMRRITFSGTDLYRFSTDEHLHVGLLLPPAGAPREDWLNIRPDGMAHVREPGFRPVNRKYTIRAIDPSSGRMDIDFVLHDDGGPGGAWAAQAKAGDMVGILGPGGRGLPPADWYLIAGDETALPAIGRMMDAMPCHARGEIIIEIADDGEEQRPDLPPGIKLNWLHRNGAPAGTTDLLRDAVRAVRLPPGAGRPFVWVGAEFAATQSIRKHLKGAGVAKADQLVVAYWRRNVSGGPD